MSELKTVWISKYALTKGVYSAEVEIKDSIEDRTGVIVGFNFYAIGRDCHFNKADAVKAANEMKIKKLKSLDKQMKKISALEFDL